MVEVTIVIPTYNRADVLSRAIDSALNQKFDDIEIIVVDDNSSDNTHKIVNNYKYDCLKFIQLEKNQGANSARNIGVRQASGDYIMFLDSDDELHPSCVEETLNTIKKEPSRCGGVFSSYQEVNNNDEKIVAIKNEVLKFEDIINGNIIGGFTGKLFQRNVFENVGYLDENLKESQDYEFYIRVLEKYYMVGVNKVLYSWYRRDDRIWTRLDGTAETQQYFLKKHGDKLSSQEKSRRYKRIGLASIEKRNKKEATNAFKNAMIKNDYRVTDVYLYIISLIGLSGFKLFYNMGKKVKHVFKST